MAAFICVAPIFDVAATPQLRCDQREKPGRSADPGVLLACFEQTQHAKKPAQRLTLAQHLEAAGQFDAAAFRWRAYGRKGSGTPALEATRRANALAELGLAQDAAAQGKARHGKAHILSAMQTFLRQARSAAWPVPAAIVHAAIHIARAARLRREVKRWRRLVPAAPRSRSKMGKRSPSKRSPSKRAENWFAGRLTKPGRRAPQVMVERCLGGAGYDFIRAAVALPGGRVLAVGEATAADGDTQLRTWLLDGTGRTKRRADFGAGGPDRPLALTLDGSAGAWVVGETAGTKDSDAFFVRLDLQGRVRGHDERDGGGRDRAVAVVRVGRGRALALAEADVDGAADLWLLRLDAAGKIRGDARIGRPGVQRAFAFVLQGDRAWVGGSDAGAGLLEAFDGAGNVQATVRGTLPGVVLAIAPARRGSLWVVGRRKNGKGWFATVDKRGRLQLKKRFKPVFTADQRIQLLPSRRGAQLLVTAADGVGPAWIGTAWIGNVGRRGRLKNRSILSAGGATDVRFGVRANRRTLWLLGGARGCGRGLSDGWFAVTR